MNKIVVLGNDTEKINYQSFMDLMPNIAHLLCGMHMNDNIKEKAVKLGFEKLEITTLMHDISGKQIKDVIEEDLVDSLTNEKFRAYMEFLEQKWKNIGEKGERIYYYFKNNKLNRIKDCMPAKLRSVVGLGFPPKPYLQNANECMDSVLTPSGSTRRKDLSEVAERIRTIAKEQENQVILSLLDQGKSTHFDPYKLR